LTRRSSVCEEVAATLGDVLPAAARRLHHLVHGAGTLVEEAVAKRDRRIVDHCRDLEGSQVAIATAGTEPQASLRPGAGGFL